jgi:hypothetical protein
MTQIGRLKPKFFAGHARYHRDDLDACMTKSKEPITAAIRNKNAAIRRHPVLPFPSSNHEAVTP